MSKSPQERLKELRNKSNNPPTAAGGLYDRHGPIPTADAIESDTDSAWALFQESVQLQDNPKTVPPNFEETQHSPPEFEPTDFGGSSFDTTRAAPLKP